MTNTFCPLNTDPDEDVHVNMAMGSWPITVIGKFTGKPVITNYRWCSCELTGLSYSQGGEMQVFYYEF